MDDRFNARQIKKEKTGSAPPPAITYAALPIMKAGVAKTIAKFMLPLMPTLPVMKAGQRSDQQCACISKAF